METLKVLVCDDEMGMRAGVSRALRNFRVELPDIDAEVDFSVEEAETGTQALELIEREAPHILLLDHKLPDLLGLDVLERLAPKNLEMLTIMITAYASIQTAVRATKQGAYDFLPKPFTPTELKDSIRKAARQILVSRQARKLAEERRRVRFQFISVVAHELKAPINAIEGYLNVLGSGTADENPELQKQIVERCVTRIGGMRKMITDLLDLTRIEAGTKVRELTEVNVGDVARHALETAQPEADARGITLNLEGGDDVTIEGDASEIEIILNNLVSNAVKYNKDGGRVDVNVGRRDGAVAITVADTGIGMKEEDAARLFNDFVRIKNEKTQGILGSGLGLSILKKLVQLYHGDVSVKSKPEEGSTFRVLLRHTSPEDTAASIAVAEPAESPAEAGAESPSP